MKSNNQINIPEAKNRMDQFKMEAASEVGVNLQNGYNGNLTSREDKLHRRPDGQCCATFERPNRIAAGHKTTVKYIFAISV